MSKTFSQDSSEAFLNFTKSALRRKKTHQRVLTDCFEKNFEGKTSLYVASQKRNLLALFHFFSTWVFITKLLAKTVEKQSLAKYS